MEVFCHEPKFKRASATARMIAQITPSKFAGHSMLCPYEGKGANREIGVPRDSNHLSSDRPRGKGKRHT
jgi:hypothetical protein